MKAIKRIEYKKTGEGAIHTTSRGNKLRVWWNDYAVWTAPEYKLWASKKYLREDVELIEIV